MTVDSTSNNLRQQYSQSAGVVPLTSLSIVVPAYNEEARLASTLERMTDYFSHASESYMLAEILVVSDGSTDGTAEIVQKFAATHTKVRLIDYSPNHGKGYAVRIGMLEAKGERVLFSDADLSTPIEEIEKLMVSLDKGNDIAIGSRDVIGSQLEKHQSFIREFGGRTFNKLVQLMAVPGIHDTQCGFKLFTDRAAHAVFSQCRVDHFAFDVEALYVARRVFNLKIDEVPVRWAHQEGSKVRFVRDAIRMVKTLFRIRTTPYASVSAVAKITPR